MCYIRDIVKVCKLNNVTNKAVIDLAALGSQNRKVMTEYHFELTRIILLCKMNILKENFLVCSEND